MAEKEYIERNALIEAWERECAEATDFFDAFDFALEDVPVADVVEVKHGKWIHDYNNVYGCSECLGRETMSPKKLKNYCPNCGAKMDGGAE